MGSDTSGFVHRHALVLLSACSPGLHIIRSVLTASSVRTLLLCAWQLSLSQLDLENTDVMYENKQIMLACLAKPTSGLAQALAGINVIPPPWWISLRVLMLGGNSIGDQGLAELLKAGDEANALHARNPHAHRLSHMHMCALSLTHTHMCTHIHSESHTQSQDLAHTSGNKYEQSCTSSITLWSPQSVIICID